MMRSTARYYRLLLATLFCVLSAIVAPISIARAMPQDGNSNVVTYEILDARYHTAVRDAQELRTSKIDTQLTLIAKSNPHLQWKTFNGQEYVKVGLLSDTFYDNKVGAFVPVGVGRTTWVLVPWDLKEWYKQHFPTNKPSASQLLLRLRQLLGMPPDVEKTRIVELWVRARDLKRPSIEPAIDKEIDLATLFTRQTDQGKSIWFTPDGDESYNNWFYRQCAESYVMPVERDSLYPWTRLGYTYDWGNPQYPHIGLSEFIIWGGAEVNVNVDSSQKPEDYFLH